MAEDKTHFRESELGSVDHRAVPIPAPGIGTRIDEVISLIGSKASAARAASVSPESLRRYVNELAMPPFDVMANLAETAGVNMRWLATGRGAKLISADAAVSEESGAYEARPALADRVDRDDIAKCILKVERTIGDAFPDHVRARWAADAIIEKIRELESGSASLCGDPGQQDQ